MMVVVYSDRNLDVPVQILEDEGFRVAYYPEDPWSKPGEQYVWVVEDEEDFNNWPLNGTNSVPVFAIKDTPTEKVGIKFMEWLKHHKLSA